MQGRLNLWVLTVAIIASGVCWAQPPEDNDANSKRVDLEFPGGTVADYVNAVRKVAPELNILLHTEAEAIRLPRIELHNIPPNLLVPAVLAEFEDPDQGLELRVRNHKGTVFHVTAHRFIAQVQVKVFSVAGIVVDKPGDPKARAKVLQKLHKRIDVNFDNTKLGSVLDYFSETADVNMSVDWGGVLNNTGIEQDHAVTLRLKSVPVAVALKIVFANLEADYGKLYYTVDDGLVRITARRPPQQRTTIQQLLTAVETALELTPHARGPAQLKYHSDTGLLIARGSEQQLQTIDQVVNSVRSGSGPPSPTIGQLNQRLRKLEAEVRNLRERTVPKQK